MRLWGASLILGVLALLLGGALFLLKLHRTIGLGGIGLGAVLVAIGLGLLYKERGARVKASRNLAPAQKTALSVPAIRTLMAVGIIILVGVGAFYATTYLVSVQGGTQSSSVPGITFTLSQNSQSYSSTSGPPLTRTTSICTAAMNGICYFSTSTSKTEASASASSREATTTLIGSTTLTSTQSTLGVVLVIIPSGAATNSSLDFEPATVTVVLGVNNSIMWRNEDSTNHGISFISNPLGYIRGSSPIMPSKTYSIELNDTGTYVYQDPFYPNWMKGTITVLP